MEFKEKVALLMKANEAYYVENVSIMSDNDYDQLLAEVTEHANKNDIALDALLKRVGSSLTEDVKKVEHKRPMLSLANSYDEDDVLDFMKGISRTNRFIIEQKIDGLSCSLKFKDGKLYEASTRGNGTVGEDVTENVMISKNIPNTISIKDDIEIRGEVVIFRDVFEVINDARAMSGESTFKTARNLASGTLRAKDSKMVAERFLSFIAYYIVGDNGAQSQVLHKLNELGFKTPSNVIFELGRDDKARLVEILKELKTSAEYETDGCVIKVDDISLWDSIGTTAKSPKWAIAYKYPTEEVRSKVLSVDWQLGRTGKLTPVANIEPVVISGTTVSRATLNNPRYIKAMDLKINDRVVVVKAAEIIPQILYPVFSERDKTVYNIEIPRYCPVCGSELVNDEVNLFCANDSCPAVQLAKIIHFSDRACMDIQGLGEKVIKEFFDLGILKSIPDIYKLKDKKELVVGKIEGWKDKSWDKLVQAIEKSKSKPFTNVLASLQIDRLGKTMSRRVVEKFKSIDSIIEALMDDPEALSEIQGISADSSIIISASINKNMKLIEELMNIGLNFEENLIASTGPTVSITGTIKDLTRDEVTALLTGMGFKVIPASKKTKILILGNNYSDAKANKVGVDVNIIHATTKKEIEDKVGGLK